jgi:hypothetical protein
MAPPFANPTPTGRQLIYGQLLNIEIMTRIPYAEVVDRINGNISSTNRSFGGFIRYDKLIQEAKKDVPFPPKVSNPGSGNLGGFEINDGHQSLITAAAEAIVYKAYRDQLTILGTPLSTVIHDPVAQGTSGFQGLPQPFKSLAQEAIKSFGNKTPDLLMISAPQKGVINNKEVIVVPILNNQINLDNSKDLTLFSDRDDGSNKITVSPLEITTTADSQKIKDKIKKFEKYGSDFFNKNPNVKYIPILELDYAQYMKISASNKKIICKAMKKVGGVITLHQGLLTLSKSIAKEAIENFTPLIRVYENLPPKQVNLLGQIPFTPKLTTQRKPSSSQLIAKSKELDSKDYKEQKPTNSGFFEKSKEWFKNIKQSFSSNKNTKEINNVEKPIQKESAAESYQRMASGAKSNPSFFQRAGLDVLNNSNHLDLAIASHSAHKNLDSVEILKQSPAYLAKRPAVAKMWLDKMVDDGGKIAGEEHLNTPAAQKIIQNYNDRKAKVQPSPQVEQQVGQQVEQQKSVSDFDRAVALVKEHSSEFEKLGLNVLDNRKDLLAGISFAIVSTGNDPSKLLRQSPEFLAAATPAQGEALIGESIEKAKSTLETAKSEPEPEKQKSQDRGYER